MFHRPAPLWLFSDFGAVYKYPDWTEPKPTHQTTGQTQRQPNRTPYNQQQTFSTTKTILCTSFHRNIMTVSKTPVNKHDIVSNIPLSVEVYQVSLASVNCWKFLWPTTRPNPPKSLKSRSDPIQPNPYVGRPNPWTTLVCCHGIILQFHYVYMCCFHYWFLSMLRVPVVLYPRVNNQVRTSSSASAERRSEGWSTSIPNFTSKGTSPTTFAGVHHRAGDLSSYSLTARSFPVKKLCSRSTERRYKARSAD